MTGPQNTELIDLVKRKVAQFGRINVLGEMVEVGEVHDLGKVLSNFVRELSTIPHIDKYAVVTDLKKFTAVANIEHLLVPGIEVRPFGLSEKDQALA